MHDSQARHIEIHGAVQGVGFRPFVYRLATQLGLCGWVLNDSQGVFIEIEGPPAQLDDFVARLSHEKPVHAQIHELSVTTAPSVGYTSFTIRHSTDRGAKTVLVQPDLATCPACLADILEPTNRRYGYPFTNCTNCGPRFSIVQALPYDRPNTTLRDFPLCPACRAEYDDPGDRRFHAQPNACPVCGPQLAFYSRGITPGTATASTQRRRGAETQREWDLAADRGAGGTETDLSEGRWPEQVHGWALQATAHAALHTAATALAAGAIVAVKGLGGFQLMVDARSEASVQQLRARKPRPDKPFAVMARDLAQARQLVDLDAAAAVLLAGPAAPILLLPRRAGSPVAAAVTPGNPNLGVMLPCTPLHHLLLRAIDFPLVATSGNVTDEPICIDEWEAMARLGHAADAFLIHDRPIARHVDDSVVWVVEGAAQLLRRARGYAPLPIRMGKAGSTLLAVGAQLKNTIALSIGREIFVSQHIGDLESAPALAAFERVIADFLRLYEAAPVAIAHDLHPDYLSTQWAAAHATGLPGAPDATPPRLVPVQHHHAHLAACLAENDHPGAALGVIWDGTGYGPDGTIWGGEFLVGDAADYRRVAHLRPFRLPGGDAAAREPKRVALALLWELYGESVLDWEDLAPVRAHDTQARRVLGQMLGRGINTPETTSAGRLFDGIAALIDLHQGVSFEGQAAMALEFACSGGVADAYPLPLVVSGDSGLADQLDWRPLVAAVVDDLRRGVDRRMIAARFHNAAVAAMVVVANAVGVSPVALSGGCFQNRRLTEQAAAALRAAGFGVLLHRQVPPNDGGISLGQIAVAQARHTVLPEPLTPLVRTWRVQQLRAQ